MATKKIQDIPETPAPAAPAAPKKDGVTVEQVLVAVSAIGRLLPQLSEAALLAYKLGRISDRMAPEQKRFSALRQELYAKYGEELVRLQSPGKMIPGATVDSQSGSNLIQVMSKEAWEKIKDDYRDVEVLTDQGASYRITGPESVKLVDEKLRAVLDDVIEDPCPPVKIELFEDLKGIQGLGQIIKDLGPFICD